MEQMAAPRGMKSCPFCAEDVREEEAKCPYCESNIAWVRPAAAVAAGQAKVPAVITPAVAVNRQRGGLAVAALVLGIVGLVSSCVPLLGCYALPLTILAIVFGILGRAHGMGIAGLLCGLIGTVIGAYWIYVIVAVAEDIHDNLHDAARRVEQIRRTIGPSCIVGSRVGVCIDTGDCPGRSVEGYCYGAANVQCCLR